MASGKILVVDDDRNICELLRLYIEKEGFDVVIANDGRQALDLFDSEKPDLIMLDIMLPELDGWQVCREIRKKSQCPIIMLTAKGEVFDKVLGLELGADSHPDYPERGLQVICVSRFDIRLAEKAGVERGDFHADAPFYGADRHVCHDNRTIGSCDFDAFVQTFADTYPLLAVEDTGADSI